MDFKNIHIGNLLKNIVLDRGIEISRICDFMKCTEERIQQMYNSENLDTDILLKWSKLLEYDFFRIYSQHLILYAPPRALFESKIKNDLPVFRKNIYTREIINFILERIETGEMTKQEVFNRYNIPKTTLYKWVNKYRKTN